MKLPGALQALAGMVTPHAPPAAPRVAGRLPTRELAALLTLRKEVWIAWFTGDTATLRRQLGPELVAIGPESRPWHSLEDTLSGAEQFRASGAQLMSIEFGLTVNHRFGETVLLFSEYTVMFAAGEAIRTLKGRATEVFVRAAGQWVHTSWHLDAVP